jgi:hypothetical protein
MTEEIFYPTEARWQVQWGDETINAPSAFDALQTIGERSYSHADHKFPKKGIAHRVGIQYNIFISAELPDEMFLSRLAEFGIIELSVTGVAPLDNLQQALDFSEAWYGYEPEPKKNTEA